MHLLSSVLFTLRSVPVARVCCANLQPNSKHLITMDLASSAMIPSLTRSIINTNHPACFSFTIWVCVFSVIFPTSPGYFHCGKVDFHQLCCEFVQSILSCLLCFQSWFEAYWIFLWASLSGDSSSRNQYFFLRVLSYHTQLLSASEFPRSTLVSQHLATAQEFFVMLPYYDEPTFVIYHSIDLLLCQKFHGT